MSVVFWWPPDLKICGFTSGKQRFFKNDRFRPRTRCWTDYWYFDVRFGTQKSTTTPPKTLPKNHWFFIVISAHFLTTSGPFWEPISRKKSSKKAPGTLSGRSRCTSGRFSPLLGALGTLWDRFRLMGSILARFLVNSWLILDRFRSRKKDRESSML